MVKTTIEIDDERWKAFSIKVIQEQGGRAKTNVIEALIDGYVNHPNKTTKQTVDDWLKGKRKAEAKAIEEKE